MTARELIQAVMAHPPRRDGAKAVLAAFAVRLEFPKAEVMARMGVSKSALHRAITELDLQLSGTAKMRAIANKHGLNIDIGED